ncbi:MAG: type I-G CRISPR-associated RAMP protein Csb1/Cas7g [Acidimicrobiales bacterium]
MAIRYEELAAAVDGQAVGVRARIELEPLGGPGDKVFPPTYGVPDSAETKYALEKRIDPTTTQPVHSVVLDSVASQANRFELALLEAVQRGEVSIPVTSVDFSPFPDLGLDRLSDLEAPHRIFDALLRDSYDGEVLFRLSPIGQTITEATSRNAAAVFCHAPATLVFGGWDSTGPKGGRGAKYERALTSEIVAKSVLVGSKTSSRIDPAAIEKAAVVYKAADGDELAWTLDPESAAHEKGKPVLAGSRDSKGSPSGVNHGNIAPSIDVRSGGVTAQAIVATTVLSFIQLRRLRFSTGGAAHPSADGAARTALAALGLAAAVLGFDGGFDLRSRCVLVATGPVEFELIDRHNGARRFSLSPEEASALLREAAQVAADAGLPWRTEELLLRPSDRLVDLIRRSRAHAAAAGDSGE